MRQTENAGKCIIRLHTKSVCPVIVINTYHAVTFCYCLIYFFQTFSCPVPQWMSGSEIHPASPAVAGPSGIFTSDHRPLLRQLLRQKQPLCCQGVLFVRCLLLIYCFEKHLSSFCVFYCVPPFMSFSYPEIHLNAVELSRIAIFND